MKVKNWQWIIFFMMANFLIVVNAETNSVPTVAVNTCVIPTCTVPMYSEEHTGKGQRYPSVSVSKVSDTSKENDFICTERSGENSRQADISGTKCRMVYCGLIVVAVIVLILLLVGICKKDYSDKAIICIELIGVFVLVSLIFVGAYDLLMRLIDNLKDFSALKELSTCATGSEAVQKAYAQLSTELQQWLALFGVLGTFLGLVLPVGAYLLQLKAVERKEKYIDARINEKTVEMAGKMASIWKSQIALCEWQSMQLQGHIRNKLSKGWNAIYSVDVIGMLVWFSLVVTCACESGSDSDIHEASKFIHDLYCELKKEVSDKDWNRLVNDVKKSNRNINFRFQIDRTKMNSSSYDRLMAIAQEFGM